MPDSIILSISVKNYSNTKKELETHKKGTNMELKLIMDLVTQWKNITWDVINLQNISILKLQVLSIETYELLDLYKDKNYTRKQFAALLLEMQEFSWWVGTLPDSPVHDNYQQVYTLIQTLIKHYLDEPIDRQQIETLIDAIELEVI